MPDNIHSLPALASSEYFSIVNQQIIKAGYQKPSNLLIYYGWINSFNSSVNSWTNEKVAQDMAKYDLIVLGDGVQDSGHGDYSNTEII